MTTGGSGLVYLAGHGRGRRGPGEDRDGEARISEQSDGWSPHPNLGPRPGHSTGDDRATDPVRAGRLSDPGRVPARLTSVHEGTEIVFRSRKMAVLLLIGLVLITGCSRSPEAKEARYLERGDRYFKLEKYREATLEYRNALRIEENNTHALRQLRLAQYQTRAKGQAYRH